MTQATKKPSQREAENFHVLPKRDTAKEQGKAPLPEHTGDARVIDRTVDVGNLTGESSQLDQSSRTPPADRSQVS